jgi:hypothetical protein
MVLLFYFVNHWHAPEICLIERGQEVPDFACGPAKRLSEYYFPVE